ncbi:MAG: TssQ family T6SS-associated lipoprotein [Burkholderiaceae bacterium]|nr:TssQ family T6SS-associated lipoprotein [Burkholderiaceae bacterium]
MPLRLAARAAIFAGALLAGGCAGVTDLIGATSSPETAAAPVPTPGEQKLAEGVERYENGDFVGAIRALNAPEIAQSDAATRIEAGKYLAFTYCVTKRRTLCRRSFERVLALDPGFALKPAEAGHPLWGPVFVQARDAAGRREADPKRATNER